MGNAGGSLQFGAEEDEESGENVAEHPCQIGGSITSIVDKEDDRVVAMSGSSVQEVNTHTLAGL